MKSARIRRSAAGGRQSPSVCDRRGLHSMAKCAGKDVEGLACVVYSKASNGQAASETASPPLHRRVTMVPASERGGTWRCVVCRVRCWCAGAGGTYIKMDASRRRRLGGDTLASRWPVRYRDDMSRSSVDVYSLHALHDCSSSPAHSSRGPRHSSSTRRRRLVYRRPYAAAAAPAALRGLYGPGEPRAPAGPVLLY